MSYSLRRMSRLSILPQRLTSRACFSTHSNYLEGSLTHDIETVHLASEEFKALTQAGALKSPLIFLHGLFGSKNNTRTVSKQLARNMDRRVIGLDLRNFGHSPHNKRLDYPAMAADVEKFIDDSKFPAKPILVGHSMGAKVAMAVALRRPDIPQMLVSVDNSPVDLTPSSTSNFSKYVNQLRLSLEKFKYTNIKDVDAQLAKVEPHEVVRQFLMTNLKRGKAGHPITSKVPLDIIGDSIISGTIAGFPFDSNLCRWTKGPCLFIRGMKSEYVADDHIPDIGRFFPHFEIRDVDSGHWVISEKPHEFMEILQEFVERKEDE